VVGYMPKRGDFDQEYDMDADLLLADMEFLDDDTES
jgi:transcriptional adapter 2-alpha